MKAWYDDIDCATLQRIKTYSAFDDAMSKNLMVQTMYEYREKEVQDFKETNHELAETCIARKNRIAELEKENAELEKENKELKTVKIPQLERKIASIRGAHSVDCKKLNARTEQVERLKNENAELRKQVSAMSKALVLNVSEADEKLNRAKEIIKELLDTQSQLDPYRDIFKARILKAEQFLKEVSE